MSNSTASELVAKIANLLLTLLRNRTDLALTREEFRYSRISFSQFGEDLAVIRWLDENLISVSSIYIDAGCFHPIHCSNTLLLSKRGWRGINIDLSPEKIALFKNLRPNDLSVCAALSDQPRQAIRFAYEGGLTDRLGSSEDTGYRKPLSATEVETRTLDSIIQASGWQIDRVGYLNIDCEGHLLRLISVREVHGRLSDILKLIDRGFCFHGGLKPRSFSASR
jgi:FkbM family methyltransferase